jgi:U3 small nucleolar RNA-associated protein 11
MSGASMLRNAIKRITHKERAQPQSRKKLGLLEKHKDYIERATNFKNKQNYLNRLRRKASEKNEDEFYFHMHGSALKNGKHKEKKDSTLDAETVHLMKTQDLAYIIHKRQVDTKKVERLRQTVHLIGEVQPKKHTIFLDADDIETTNGEKTETLEEKLNNFDAANHFQTDPSLLNRNYNRLRLEQIETMANQRLELSGLQSHKTHTHHSENDSKHQQKSTTSSSDNNLTKKRNHDSIVDEISQRTKRAKKLETAYFELTQQRALATNKGSRKKIIVKTKIGKGLRQREIEKVVYKWKQERQK